MLGYKAADDSADPATKLASENQVVSASAVKEQEGDLVAELAKKPHTWSKGFTGALGMILVTEVGDETFIIAALLSMRNPR